MAKDITELELLITAQTDDLRRELRGVQNDLEGLQSKSAKASKGLGAGFKGALPEVTKFAAGMAAAAVVMEGFRIGIEGMIAKETKLAEFSAITGVTGQKLKEFGDAATELSNQFGTSAVDNIEAFKGVLSRLGPDFASSAEAVRMMGENINTLALASGLDATQAMDALTTAMLQFGVDLSDPLKAANEAAVMMNVMAAGAKEGAAEIPQIAEALTQAGVTAKNLNVSFVETNAAIQTLATGGKTGAEAGVALRNVMASMTKISGKAEKELSAYGISADELGKTLTEDGLNAAMVRLNKALRENGTEAEDAALMALLFGKENMAAAQILAGNTALTDKYSRSIEGTNTAQEQAGIILDTTQKKFERFSAFIENTLVGAMEAGKTALAEIYGFFESILSLNFEKAFEGAVETVRSFVEYSTLGLSEAALGWIGLGRDASDASDKLVDTGKNVEMNAINAFDKQLKLAGAINATTQATEKLNKVNKPIDPKEAERQRRLAIARIAIEMKFSDTAKDIHEAQLRNFLETVRLQEEAVKKATARTRDIPLPPGKSAAVTAAEQEEEQLAAIWREGFKQYDERWKAMGEIAATGSLAIASSMGQMFATGDAEEAGEAMLKSIGNTAISMVQTLVLAAAAGSAAKAIPTFGASLITDAPWLAAAYAGLEVLRGFVNSFAVGTNYVPYDQLAMIHKGEAVIPASQAERMRQGEAMSLGRGRTQNKQTSVRVHVSEFAGAIEDQHMRVSRRVR